jgi:hypothetical protein
MRLKGKKVGFARNQRPLHTDPKPVILSRWVVITFLLWLVAGVIYVFYNLSQCIDGCGPYHNTTNVADLDGDGDLDVVLNSLRHETDTIIWAGATLWINQGGILTFCTRFAS